MCLEYKARSTYHTSQYDDTYKGELQVKVRYLHHDQYEPQQAAHADSMDTDLAKDIDKKAHEDGDGRAEHHEGYELIGKSGDLRSRAEEPVRPHVESGYGYVGYDTLLRIGHVVVGDQLEALHHDDPDHRADEGEYKCDNDPEYPGLQLILGKEVRIDRYDKCGTIGGKKQRVEEVRYDRSKALGHAVLIDSAILRKISGQVCGGGWQEEEPVT